jgi:hypothetical protein
MKPNKISIIDLFFSLLAFLNLKDGNKLSLTNLAFAIILVKIATSPFDFMGAATLIPILASYMHKRHVATKDASSTSSSLKEVQTQLATLQESHKEIDKTVQEAKKLLSTHAMSQAFTRNK